MRNNNNNHNNNRDVDGGDDMCLERTCKQNHNTCSLQQTREKPRHKIFTDRHATYTEGLKSLSRCWRCQLRSTTGVPHTAGHGHALLTNGMSPAQENITHIHPSDTAFDKSPFSDGRCGDRQNLRWIYFPQLGVCNDGGTLEEYRREGYAG